MQHLWNHGLSLELVIPSLAIVDLSILLSDLLFQILDYIIELEKIADL